MNKRSKLNIILAAILAILLIILMINHFTQNEVNTFNPNIIKIDTAQIQTIKIWKKNSDSLNLQIDKVNNQWTISDSKLTTNPSKDAMETFLNELASLKINQIISENKADWDTFQVSNNSGIRIQVLGSENSILSDIWVGKMEFLNAMGSASQTMFNSNPSALTYIRVEGDNYVYGTSGYLSMFLNYPLNAWRDPYVFTCDTSSLQQIQFQYTNRLFELNKKDNKWFLNDKLAMEDSVKRYIRLLAKQALGSFNDDIKLTRNADMVITMNGTKKDQVKLRLWKITDSTFVVNSTVNPTFFNLTTKEPFYFRLFVNESNFLK